MLRLKTRAGVAIYMYLLGENRAPASGSLCASHPLELVLLKHRVERLIGKNEMVQDLYAKQISRGSQAFGDIAVIINWQEVSAGVVVRHNYRGGTFTQRVG